MRKQIAAANWKMNCTYQQAEKLLDDILKPGIQLQPHQQVLFAVPFPYLIMANSEVSDERNYDIAAQNCYSKKSGAYTGEVSAEILDSVKIKYCIIGHSERREYFNETNQLLAEKLNILLEYGITPLFCCGEPLSVREAGTQNRSRRSLLPMNPSGPLARVKPPARPRPRKCMLTCAAYWQSNMANP